MGRSYAATGLSIADTSGSTFVDGEGVVGEVTFSHGFTEKTSNQDITENYSGVAQLTHEIITTRTTPVYLYGMFEAEGTSTTAGITAITRIAIVNDGGTTYSNVYPWNMYSGTTIAGDNVSQLTITTSVNLATGTNSVNVEAKAGYTGTAEFKEDSNFGYIVLGK